MLSFQTRIRPGTTSAGRPIVADQRRNAADHAHVVRQGTQPVTGVTVTVTPNKPPAHTYRTRRVFPRGRDTDVR